MSENIIILE